MPTEPELFLHVVFALDGVLVSAVGGRFTDAQRLILLLQFLGHFIDESEPWRLLVRRAISLIGVFS